VAVGIARFHHDGNSAGSPHRCSTTRVRIRRLTALKLPGVPSRFGLSGSTILALGLARAGPAQGADPRATQRPSLASHPSCPTSTRRRAHRTGHLLDLTIAIPPAASRSLSLAFPQRQHDSYTEAAEAVFALTHGADVIEFDAAKTSRFANAQCDIAAVRARMPAPQVPWRLR
jgi:hypothetical protein